MAFIVFKVLISSKQNHIPDFFIYKTIKLTFQIVETIKHFSQNFLAYIFLLTFHTKLVGNRSVKY